MALCFRCKKELIEKKVGVSCWYCGKVKVFHTECAPGKDDQIHCPFCPEPKAKVVEPAEKPATGSGKLALPDSGKTTDVAKGTAACAAATKPPPLVLYHATPVTFDKIDLSKNRLSLDFNPAGKRCFYLGRDLQAAKDWAATKGGEQTIYKYTIDRDELMKLKGYVFYLNQHDGRRVKSAQEKPKTDEHNLKDDAAHAEWVRFVTEGRGGTLSHAYDYVEGPMVLNPAEVAMGKKATAGKHQVALCTAAAVDLFNKSPRAKVT